MSQPEFPQIFLSFLFLLVVQPKSCFSCFLLYFVWYPFRSMSRMWAEFWLLRVLCCDVFLLSFGLCVAFLVFLQTLHDSTQPFHAFSKALHNSTPPFTTPSVFQFLDPGILEGLSFASSWGTNSTHSSKRSWGRTPRVIQLSVCQV